MWGLGIQTQSLMLVKWTLLPTEPSADPYKHFKDRTVKTGHLCCCIADSTVMEQTDMVPGLMALACLLETGWEC